MTKSKIASFIKRQQIIILSVLLVLFSLNIAFTGMREGSKGAIVKHIITAAVSPVQKAVAASYNAAASVVNGYVMLLEVRDENETLKKNISVLQEEIDKLKEEVSLGGRLKDILAYKEQAPFKTVAASAVAFTMDKWTRTATINKGYAEGVDKDMAVVTPEGVVGRVIDAGRHASTVLLNTDLRSNIDVVVQRTRVKAVAEGNGTDGLALKYIRQLDEVQIGDQIVTSGVSGLFPKGLVVGEVTKIEKGRDNFFKFIEVRPKVEVQRLEEVLVVTNPGNSTAD